MGHQAKMPACYRQESREQRETDTHHLVFLSQRLLAGVGINHARGLHDNSRSLYTRLGYRRICCHGDGSLGCVLNAHENHIPHQLYHADSNGHAIMIKDLFQTETGPWELSCLTLSSPTLADIKPRDSNLATRQAIPKQTY